MAIGDQNNAIHLISSPVRLRDLRQPHRPHAELAEPDHAQFPLFKSANQGDLREQDTLRDTRATGASSLDVSIQCDSGVFARVDIPTEDHRAEEHDCAGQDYVACQRLLVTKNGQH